MALGYSASASTSEENKFGPTTNTSSGQHGQLVNFVAGKGNALTPTNTDSSGNPIGIYMVLGILAAAGVVWWLLRKKAH